MEITEIKSRLTLKTVLDYYGLKPDKHLRLNCPFHADKTPSLQVYYKTHTAYCFSSNCKTHGKSLDVIDFILHKEGFDRLSLTEGKHKAIEKAKALISGEAKPIPMHLADDRDGLVRSAILTRMFIYFKNAIHNSKPAQEYLEKRHLYFAHPSGELSAGLRGLEVGYNSGQFHHGKRKSEALLQSCLKVGLLLDQGKKSRTGEPAYQPFGKNGVAFPLKNKEGKIVSLYFRSIIAPPVGGAARRAEGARHFYLKNRQGLYPHYPRPNTSKLILTEAILDAATLLQHCSKLLANGYSLLALYGTNGLTEEHTEAIAQWASPLGGDREGLEIIFFFDGDAAGRTAAKKYAEQLTTQHSGLKTSTVATPEGEDVNSLLDGHEPEILTELLEQREAFIFSSEKTVDSPQSMDDRPSTIDLVKPSNLNALDFLKTGNVLETLNNKIGQCGIVGETQSRLLLFLLTLSYRNKRPLHGIVQGSSGSGKTHIISRIADLMPQEDVLRFTRITESSLYNWGEYDLFKKVIVIEDLDGLKEEALYALREFISNQVLRSSVTVKDKAGNNKSRKKEVKGQFSSLSATTKGETYEDNMNRSFLIAVDESAAQTTQIIDYQNRRAAGEINEDQEQENVQFVRDVVRNLKTYEVINPFAPHLKLPEKVHQIRRLNEMYQAVIKQVTLVNQYQRQVITTPDTSPSGRPGGAKLVTQIEDIEQATEILFESIVLKVDELDGSLRLFYEALKKHLKSEEQEFTQREIRQVMTISKTQVFRNIQSLLQLEYIKQSGGYPNRGLKYKIAYWDNFLKIREEIKGYLLRQIEQLRQQNHAKDVAGGTPRTTNGTPTLAISD